MLPDEIQKVKKAQYISFYELAKILNVKSSNQKKLLGNLVTQKIAININGLYLGYSTIASTGVGYNDYKRVLIHVSKKFEVDHDAILSKLTLELFKDLFYELYRQKDINVWRDGVPKQSKKYTQLQQEFVAYAKTMKRPGFQTDQMMLINKLTDDEANLLVTELANYDFNSQDRFSVPFLQFGSKYVSFDEIYIHIDDKTKIMSDFQLFSELSHWINEKELTTLAYMESWNYVAAASVTIGISPDLTSQYSIVKGIGFFHLKTDDKLFVDFPLLEELQQRCNLFMSWANLENKHPYFYIEKALEMENLSIHPHLRKLILKRFKLDRDREKLKSSYLNIERSLEFPDLEKLDSNNALASILNKEHPYYSTKLAIAVQAWIDLYYDLSKTHSDNPTQAEIERTLSKYRLNSPTQKSEIAKFVQADRHRLVGPRKRR